MNFERKCHFTFRLVHKLDRSLIHSWLNQPHVSDWFYGEGLENTFKYLDEFLDGLGFAKYWLALDQNHPFAFFITTNVEKPNDELSKWCSLEGDAITLDMLIGDVEYLGKGYAVPIIHEFLLKNFPNANEILIDPEATNQKAIHVYQKAGFKKIGEFIPSHSPHLHHMMKLSLKHLIK